MCRHHVHPAGQRDDAQEAFPPGPSELGVHPRGGGDQQFDVSLMCDDLDRTMAELTEKGAEFTGEVQDAGWGITSTPAHSR